MVPTDGDLSADALRFEDPASEEQERRRGEISRVIAVASDLHLSPVEPRIHVESVGRILDDAFVDYETGELKEALDVLIASGEVGTDRFGRVLPRSMNRSPIEVAKVLRKVRVLTQPLEDLEPLRPFDVSFSSRDRVLDHAIPTPTQELRLARRIAGGDGEAVNELVLLNMRLGAQLTRPYYRSTGAMDRDDYLQESALGLIRAAVKFDPDKGFRFSTYATWWIRQTARRAASDKSRTIRIPVHLDDRLVPLLAFSRKYEDSIGIEPTRAEVAENFEMDIAEVNEILDLPHEIASLDDFDLPEGCGYRERPDQDMAELLSNLEYVSALRSSFDDLSETQRLIVIRRFGIGTNAPETLEEIGNSLDITRERVRQIQDRALLTLRKALIGA